MTKVKSSLVNGNFLAFLCYSCRESVEGVEYMGTTSEPAQCRVTQQHLGLWMMMRYEGEAVADARQHSLERLESLRKSIADIFESGKRYPWEELYMLHAPKFILDIVESVLGAIFVDSGGSLEPCRAFFEKIGLLPQLRSTVASRMNVDHPREELNRWLRGSKLHFNWKDKSVDSVGLGLSLLVDSKEVASVAGCLSKDEAIIRATNKANKFFEGGCMSHGYGV